MTGMEIAPGSLVFGVVVTCVLRPDQHPIDPTYAFRGRIKLMMPEGPRPEWVVVTLLDGRCAGEDDAVHVSQIIRIEGA